MDKLGGGKEKENGVKSWWDWPSRKAHVEGSIGAVWSMLDQDSERKQLFDDYITELRTNEEVSRTFERSLQEQN